MFYLEKQKCIFIRIQISEFVYKKATFHVTNAAYRYNFITLFSLIYITQNLFVCQFQKSDYVRDKRKFF